MVQPNITAQVFRDFNITIADAQSLVNRSTLINGFQVVSPSGEILPLTNVSLSSAVNAASISGVWTLDARNIANGGPWLVKAKSTVANVSGITLGADATIEQFSINITNNPTPTFATEHNFTVLTALPSGWVATGATITYSASGMKITGTGSGAWGERVVESSAFTYSDGRTVEIDFTCPGSSSALGLGLKKANGGWGDFDGNDDSLLLTGHLGELAFGNASDTVNGAGEWVNNAKYRFRMRRSGTNSILTYFKDSGAGYVQIKQATIVTPTLVTAGTTKVLLDCGYSSELTVQRVAIS
jgi:hypothetical protein